MIALLLASMFAQTPHMSPAPLSLDELRAQKRPAYKVSTITDNAIVLLGKGRPITIRLLGSVPFKDDPAPGPQHGVRYLKEAIAGKTAYVVREPGTKPDALGYEPAYLYLADDGTLVNLDVLRKGYRRLDEKAKFALRPAFEEAAREAEAAQAGVWKFQGTLAEEGRAMARTKAELDRAKRERDAQPVTIKIPVPGYRPRSGDTAHLWAGPGTGVALADGITAYEDFYKFIRAGDRAGIDGLFKTGDVVSADPGTPVKVVEREDFVRPVAFEVRVLEGPYKDKLFWASAADLAQLREVTVRRDGKPLKAKAKGRK